MKIMCVGDLHGRTFWKDFADIKFLLMAEPDAAGYGGFVPEYQKYIFLGDYCDSFTETNDTIRENLLELIRFKTLYPENVILLWGNHDVNYYLNLPWLPMKGNTSGFRPDAHYDLFEIFNRNRNLFQLAYQEKNYLFSHAGVHYGWFQYIFTKAIKGLDMENLTIAEQLNEAFDRRIDCIFDVDFHRGGHKKVGGPLWCDKKLLNKILKYTHQICGHNPVDDIYTLKIGDSSITFCDVLHKKPSFYSLTI